jgi:hypothetical protein
LDGENICSPPEDMIQLGEGRIFHRNTIVSFDSNSSHIGAKFDVFSKDQQVFHKLDSNLE